MCVCSFADEREREREKERKFLSAIVSVIQISDLANYRLELDFFFFFFANLNLAIINSFFSYTNKFQS